MFRMRKKREDSEMLIRQSGDGRIFVYMNGPVAGDFLMNGSASHLITSDEELRKFDAITVLDAGDAFIIDMVDD